MAIIIKSAEINCLVVSERRRYIYATASFVGDVFGTLFEQLQV